MPLFQMKRIWDYCTYNKPFFILIILLFCVLYFLQQYTDLGNLVTYLFMAIFNVFLFGYGMAITQDVINDGIRLPKIMIKDILVMGIKSGIVYFIYFFVQAIILDCVSDPLNFPEFNLEDLLLELPKTLDLLFSHSVGDTLIFIVLGAFVFYITTFFIEIALARLADTGSLKSAFELFEIKRDIDLIGWRTYAKHCTLIILAIVIFAALGYIATGIEIIDYIWDILLSIFIFVTQYWGIGAIYAQIKEKNSIPLMN